MLCLVPFLFCSINNLYFIVFIPIWSATEKYILTHLHLNLMSKMGLQKYQPIIKIEYQPVVSSFENNCNQCGCQFSLAIYFILTMFHQIFYLQSCLPGMEMEILLLVSILLRWKYYSFGF